MVQTVSSLYRVEMFSGTAFPILCFLRLGRKLAAHVEGGIRLVSLVS